MPKNSGLTEQIIARLARLPDVGSRIKFLTRNQLLSPLIVKQLDEAVSHVVRVDLDKARHLAIAAATVANRLDDAESHAYAARALANSLWFRGRNEQAAQHHSRATDLFEHAGNRMEAARTLSSSIQPLILADIYVEAGKSDLSTGCGENLPCTLRSVQCTFILAQQEIARRSHCSP